MLKTFSSAKRCPSSSWYFASAKAVAATCTAAWRVASSASVARESTLKSGSPTFTRLPTSTFILVTTPAISVPTAMFSVLVSTSPTAATVWAYDEAGGGEGGLVASRLGCERTTEMTPNVSAAIATIGSMNRLIDFQVSRTMSGQPLATKATLFSIITPPFFMQALGQRLRTQGFRSRSDDAIRFSQSGHRPCGLWHRRDERHGCRG